MTDYLEPYRRLARSIRFVPPLNQQQPYQRLTEPAPVGSGFTITPVSFTQKPSDTSASEPPIDPSARAAELIREAVSRPTVLPVVYQIPENLGDRISRLAPARSKPISMPAPKLPMADMTTAVIPAPEQQVNAPVAVEVVPGSSDLAHEDTATPEVAPLEAIAEAPAAIETTTEPKGHAATPESTVPKSSVPEHSELDPASSVPSSPEEPLEATTHILESVANQLPESNHPPESPTDAATEICPECGSTDIRVQGKPQGKKKYQKYQCKTCNHQFTRPLEEKEPVSKARSKRQAKGFGTKAK